MTYGRILRFATIGVINTGIYYALYLVLRMSVPYLVAHVCAFLLAMTGSYFLNCYFTFRTRPSWRSFMLFPLSNVVNFLVSTAGLYVLVQHVGMDERVAAIPAAALAIPFTFLIAQFALTGGTREQPSSGSEYQPSEERTA